MIWFGSIWFYGISTFVGYFVPNRFYTYILTIIKSSFLENVFSEPERIFSHTVKWFHLFQSNTNNSLYY